MQLIAIDCVAQHLPHIHWYWTRSFDPVNHSVLHITVNRYTNYITFIRRLTNSRLRFSIHEVHFGSFSASMNGLHVFKLYTARHCATVAGQYMQAIPSGCCFVHATGAIVTQSCCKLVNVDASDVDGLLKNIHIPRSDYSMHAVLHACPWPLAQWPTYTQLHELLHQCATVAESSAFTFSGVSNWLHRQDSGDALPIRTAAVKWRSPWQLINVEARPFSWCKSNYISQRKTIRC